MSESRQVYKYTFYRFDPSWRALPVKDRREAISEFLALVAEHEQHSEFRTYSTAGLKADTEFLIWQIATSAEAVHDFGMELVKTALYPFLRITHSYLAVTRPSQYIPPHTHVQEPPAANTSKWLFIYPFVKTKGWYQIPWEERRAMMAQHTATGHKYPTVRINTGYSFGLDDQEFVVAFEGDRVDEFMELVQEMRSSKATAHTERDTPMFTCLRLGLKEILERLSFKEAGARAVG